MGGILFPLRVRWSFLLVVREGSRLRCAPTLAVPLRKSKKHSGRSRGNRYPFSATESLLGLDFNELGMFAHQAVLFAEYHLHGTMVVNRYTAKMSRCTTP